jgi:hypothetical protein
MKLCLFIFKLITVDRGGVMRKPYLVDVPVMLRVFIRPGTLKRVFDVIREARPSILFLVSDGPRNSVGTDRAKIEESRKIVENIDWECTVYKIYFDENIGLYQSGIRARNFIFEKVDRCIFLEDDLVPSVSFFRFCAELLEKYKDDLRVHRICGTNTLGIYEDPKSDYFFSKEGSIWGFAIWRRTYDQFDYEHKYGQDSYIMERLKENVIPAWYRRERLYAKGELVDGHIAGPEFFFQAACGLQHSLNIVPKKNMISNIGVVEGSTHSANNINKLPRGIQKLFNSTIYEYDFPLNHPKYIVDDNKYYKKVNRVFAFGHSIISMYRKFETAVRYMIYGDTIGVLKKLKKRILRNETEK